MLHYLFKGGCSFKGHCSRELSKVVPTRKHIPLIKDINIHL